MEGYVKYEIKGGGSALRGKNCDLSALPVTDPTLAAGEAGGGGDECQALPI